MARRMAEERGVNVADIQGTGPSGRVIRADVEEFRGMQNSSDISPGLRLTQEGHLVAIYHSSQQLPHLLVLLT